MNDEETARKDVMTENELEERTRAFVALPPIRNDEGFVVTFGTSKMHDLAVYCNRNLGHAAIPGSDGRCGPVNGPQCKSCKRLQRGPGRVDIMRRKFPGLPDAAFVGALRRNGGTMVLAIKCLREDVNAKECEVRSNLALLPVPMTQSQQTGPRAATEEAAPLAEDNPNPDEANVMLDRLNAIFRRGEREEAADPDEGAIFQLMETFNVEHNAADVALRRNRNNVGRAGEWILDVGPVGMQAAIREREEEVAARAGGIDFLKKRQTEEVRRALGSVVPQEVLSMADECASFEKLEWNERVTTTAVGQHPMCLQAKSSRDNDAEEDGNEDEISHCFHCAGQIGGQYSGRGVCKLCRLCEGCVQTQLVAAVCPRLPNGGHLHHHALIYSQDRRSASCDLKYCHDGEAKEQCQVRACLWTCSACDFDSCAPCLRQQKPQGFDRRAGTNVPEENCDDVMCDLFPPFDETVAEREAAARWEGNYLEEEVEIIVGNGAVGRTEPLADPMGECAPREEGNRRGGRLVRRNDNFHRDPSLTTEMKLSDEASMALHCFCSERSDGEVVAAADITLAEAVLRRLHAVNDKATSRFICECIAAGRLDMAGAVLLSEAFAPCSNVNLRDRDGGEAGDNRNESDEASDTGVTCLCCHGVIDSSMAPDGSVGCFKGHSMHASCAADLLLGGKKCPACMLPLFYAKIPRGEAKVAAEMAEKELAVIEQRERKHRKLSSGDDTLRDLGAGDVVRLSSDIELCAKTMKENPESGGWSDEMQEECGREYSIVDVVKDDTSGEVATIHARPLLLNHCLVPVRRHGFRCRNCNSRVPSSATGRKKCKQCAFCQKCCLKTSAGARLCDSGGQQWSWHPSLVDLVRRSGRASVGNEACVSRAEATAKDAKNLLIRLRAELAVCKAARETNKTLLPPRPNNVTRNLTKESESAILDISDTVSPSDWYRARHLLLIARLWGDSVEAKARRSTLYQSVRDGALDSVARIVRRYNAAQAVEAARWSDAVAETHEYIVEPSATVQLYARPSLSAPKTGYSLPPKTRFFSEKEIIDESGMLWLQVSDRSFFDQSSVKGDVINDGHASIVGARVIRGKKWGRRDQDGGIGNKGTIVVARRVGAVVIQWDGNPRLYNYEASSNSQCLAYAPATPPPQGYVCFRPAGPGSPAVASLARSPYRCFCCGDGILAPKHPSAFKPAKQINEGDQLYVAATLEPVRAQKIREDRVYCVFIATEDEGTGDKEQGHVRSEDCIWYRRDDLLACSDASAYEGTSMNSDIVVVQGRPRTRRELVLMLGGDVERAKIAWAEAKGEAGDIMVEDVDGLSFASCSRGHILHARCFQGALLSGRSCPTIGCNEPLFLPQIELRQEEGTCCSSADDDNNQEAEAEAQAFEAVSALAERPVGNPGDEVDEHELSNAGLTRLKMCPSCCAGPLMNKECRDMKAHHGQCTASALGSDRNQQCTPEGTFRIPASEIVARTMNLSEGESVADVLPRCPKHNVAVMFSGCMVCGYLFTETDWNDMPQWDPKAKELLDLDSKKRKAAMLLAEQTRAEATMLEFERSALWKLKEDEQSLSAPGGEHTYTEQERAEPPGAPVVPAYEVNLHVPENTLAGNTEHTLVDLFMDDGGDY